MKLAITTKAIHWKTLIDVVSTIHDELEFAVKEDGLHFALMDPSHVAMIQFFWQKENFAKYEIDEKMVGKFIGLLCDEMGKIFKRIDQTDDVTISFEDSNVTITSPTKQFGLRALEPNFSENPTPKIKFEDKFEIPLGKLKDVVLDVATVSDYVTFIGKDALVFFEGKDDRGTCKGQIDAKSKTDFKATFSIEYLRPIVNALTSNNITIEFASAKPLHLISNIEGMGIIDFFLAPRVES